VTPGTTVDVVKPTLEFETGMKLGDFGLATNPEFLREGRAVSDTMSPDRIVIGTLDRFSEASLVSLYKGFLKQLPTVVKTTPTNAELIKYASNSFLATKVTFVNEIANLCSKFPGADVSTVARGMGLDMRIGPQFLKAGLGYGGSCFPKDVKALLAAAREKGVRLGVAAAADSGNEARPSVAVELAERLIGDLSKKRIAVLGLAFKPGSDDMREAVSVKVVKLLQKRGARVSAYDPVANSNARRVIGNTVRFCSSARSCLTGSDCCIVVTEWSEFAELRPGQLKRLMRTPTVVDGRRILRPELFIRAGVKFAAVGLGPSAY
jgi:UDPglucose 6-dehydrogenase